MCNGAMLLVFGVLFFLNTLGVWPEFTLVKYWPLILIAAGLHKMFCGCRPGCGCSSCAPMKNDSMMPPKPMAMPPRNSRMKK